MSDAQRHIYSSEADRYQALIGREDYLGAIPRAIDAILPVDGLDILDLGAGTGRLALLLAARARTLLAFDASAGMLRVCRQRLLQSGLTNWLVQAADHRQLPVPAHCADLAVSGWSISYLSVWNPGTGTAELDRWLAEMERVLRPEGRVLLFESLGTGNEQPVRLEHLEPTYRWLEARRFEHTWIRTDYRFESLDEAVDLAGFFFGPEMAGHVRGNRSVILPECTGVWWTEV